MKKWSLKIFGIVAVAALVCQLGMGMGEAEEFEQTDLDRLLQRNRCSGCNLTGADLSGANLWMAFLRGANLFQADLTGAMLGGADLSGANLTGASWADGRRCAKGSIGQCN